VNLVGVASLAMDPAEKSVSFLAATTADYCDLLSAPRLRREFMEAALAELKGNSVRFLTLANLPSDSNTGDILRSVTKANGYHAFVRTAYLCAQVQLGSGENRLELKAALAAKKKIRRYLRAMEREGPVSFVHLRSREEIAAALPEFIDAHVARFAATGRSSSLETPERRRFLEELAKRFDDGGVVTLSQLRIQDQPVAWNFGFRFHKSWFWYQPTFDSRYEDNSPGHCLLARIVMEACEIEGMDVVDLGLGAEGYKERFGNSTRQTLHVSISDSWPRHVSEVARYRAASALKRSPKVEAAVRRALGRE
jgi:CelD/BcsL family acetyltransferase involved in cellulose biosynthesis